MWEVPEVEREEQTHGKMKRRGKPLLQDTAESGQRRGKTEDSHVGFRRLAHGIRISGPDSVTEMGGSREGARVWKAREGAGQA